jgi:hypothetical protein
MVMTAAIKERLDWVSGAFGGQLLFFLVGVFVYANGISSGHGGLSSQLYLAISVLLLALTAVNAIVSFGILRQFLGLSFAILSCFIIPFAFNTYGMSLNYVALCGMLYVMLVIAISPKYVGVGTLLASIGFACYLHYDAVVFLKLPVYDKDLEALERRLGSEGEAAMRDAGVKFFKVPKEMNLKDACASKEVYGDPAKWEFLYKANKSRVDGPDRNVQSGTVLIVPPLPKLAPMDLINLGVWFVAGALIAFCWRLLVGKMFELYALSTSNNSKVAQKQLDDANGQLDGVKKEFQLLKEEISLQVIEMNRITGFKK